MKIAIGCDHAGVELKEVLIQLITELNHDVLDKGPFTTESVDYPDFGHAVATAVDQRHADLGVVICGSGNGINMTVNKHQGIRGALCWTPEIAALARQHNNANIVAIPARFISTEEAKLIIAEFINQEFEGGRHQRRVGKIPCS
ncbi:MAG: ribose 5-phosphate isomerase B [Schleiferiaceae bacterium]|nr:ribose 5-phosphate isomerase B [Schleiferiaceae bacterium]|tara:strand:+ start:390 stop:821 length:432 start_codon:yes stop_codon:yes gene_type:complete